MQNCFHKYILTLIGVLLLVFYPGKATGQTISLNTQYLMDGHLLLSPSWAGIPECFSIGTTGKLQWAGVEDAPKTITLSFQGRPFYNVGMGANVWYDMNGAYTQWKAQYNFAYHLYFDRNRQHFLSLGIAAQLNNKSLRGDKFDDSSNGDPSAYVATSMYTVNFSLGATYLHERYFATLAVTDFLPTRLSKEAELYEPKNVTNLNFYTGYLMGTRDYLSFEPSLMYNHSFTNNVGLLDVNAKGAAAFGINELSLTLSLRSMFFTENQGVMLLGVMGGYRVGKVNLFYSYDIGLNKQVNQWGGTHQVGLSINFLCNNKPNLCNCYYW